MEELSHDLGNPAPPRLDEGVQDVSKSQINQWTVLDDKDKEVSPGVRSGEGRVAAHEETDQQSEHDKFCLTPHLDLNIWYRIKTRLNKPVLCKTSSVLLTWLSAFAAMLSLWLPWRDWSLWHSPRPPSVSQSGHWHPWPDAVSPSSPLPGPAHITSKAWMSHTQRYFIIFTSTPRSDGGLARELRRVSHKYRSVHGG